MIRTSQVCRRQYSLRPVFPSVTHRAAGSGSPQCHGTRCRQCRCAASGLSSVLSLTGLRGQAAHKCCDCWCPASALLPPCLPSGQANVDVAPTRIPTSKADGQQVVPSTTPETRRWPFRFSALCRLRQRTPAPPSVRCRRFHRRFCPSLAQVGLYGPARAAAQPVRPQAGRLTAHRPGLRGGRDRGDLTNPPGIPPGPPTQEPSCWESSAYRCVRDCLRLRA